MATLWNNKKGVSLIKMIRLSLKMILVWTLYYRISQNRILMNLIFLILFKSESIRQTSYLIRFCSVSLYVETINDSIFNVVHSVSNPDIARYRINSQPI